MRLGQTLFLGFLVGILYFDVDNNQAGIQDRQGALFFVIVNQGSIPHLSTYSMCSPFISYSAVTSMFGILVTFPAERQVYIREHSDHAYSTLSVCYVLSRRVVFHLTNIIRYITLLPG